MNLSRLECVVVEFPTEEQPDPVELSFDNGGTWNAATTVTGGIRITLAGPDARIPDDVEPVVLALGRNIPIGRMLSADETPVDLADDDIWVA